MNGFTLAPIKFRGRKRDFFLKEETRKVVVVVFPFLSRAPRNFHVNLSCREIMTRTPNRRDSLDSRRMARRADAPIVRLAPSALSAAVYEREDRDNPPFL